MFHLLSVSWDDVQWKNTCGVAAALEPCYYGASPSSSLYMFVSIFALDIVWEHADWAGLWMGMDGKMLLVNRELVLPQTKLKYGDRVEVRFSSHITRDNLQVGYYSWACT
jgi:hypothetical protein